MYMHTPTPQYRKTLKMRRFINKLMARFFNKLTPLSTPESCHGHNNYAYTFWYGYLSLSTVTVSARFQSFIIPWAPFDYSPVPNRKGPSHAAGLLGAPTYSWHILSLLSVLPMEATPAPCRPKSPDKLLRAVNLGGPFTRAIGYSHLASVCWDLSHIRHKEFARFAWGPPVWEVPLCSTLVGDPRRSRWSSRSRAQSAYYEYPQPGDFSARPPPHDLRLLIFLGICRDEKKGSPPRGGDTRSPGHQISTTTVPELTV